MLKDIQLPSLQESRLNQRLVMMHKIIHNNVDLHLDDHLEFNTRDPAASSTRHHNPLSLKIPSSKTNCHQKSFFSEYSQRLEQAPLLNDQHCRFYHIPEALNICNKPKTWLIPRVSLISHWVLFQLELINYRPTSRSRSRSRSIKHTWIKIQIICFFCKPKVSPRYFSVLLGFFFLFGVAYVVNSGFSIKPQIKLHAIDLFFYPGY